MTESWLCPNVDCGHRLRTGSPAELSPEVDVCPHCGAAADAFVPLVTVASFPEPYLAHLVRSRLEADGIVASLSDEHLASMTHIAGDGGVKLQVRADQVEAALAIMQEDASQSDEADADEAAPVSRSAAYAPASSVEDDAHVAATVELPCPRCGAGVPSTRPAVRFLPRVFGVRRSCVRCGNAWRA